MRREWPAQLRDPDPALRWAPPGPAHAGTHLRTLELNPRETHPRWRLARGPLLALLVGAGAMLGIVAATPVLDTGLDESARREAYSLGFADGTEQTTSAAGAANSGQLQREYTSGVSDGQSLAFFEIQQLEAANYAQGFADGLAAATEMPEQ